MVRGHATVDRLSNNFFRRFKQLEKILKNVANGHATVVGGHTTVDRLSNNVLWTFQAIKKNFKRSHWTVTRQRSEVKRSSADCQQTFFRRFEPLGKILKKSLNGHATTVGGQRPSADCQTTFFRRFEPFREILKKVTQQSRDSGRRSRDRRTTVKQRLSTFQAIWKNFEKCHSTVTPQWSEVTRPSDDCQTTLSTFQAIWKNLEKSLSTVTRQWSEVRWPSADCQTKFFRRFEPFREILKKVTQQSRDSGRRSRDRRTTVKQRLSTFQAIWKNFEKCHSTVTPQWSEVTRPSADCQTTFIDVSINSGTLRKKSLNGHATVVKGHATVGLLSNNVFWTFQAIRKFFEKSRWTVTRQWSEVTRPSDDCQTTFLDVSSN